MPFSSTSGLSAKRGSFVTSSATTTSSWATTWPQIETSRGIRREASRSAGRPAAPGMSWCSSSMSETRPIGTSKAPAASRAASSSSFFRLPRSSPRRASSRSCSVSGATGAGPAPDGACAVQASTCAAQASTDRKAASASIWRAMSSACPPGGGAFQAHTTSFTCGARRRRRRQIVAGEDLRLRVQVGQAHHVDAREVELAKRAFADRDRGQDAGPDGTLLQGLRDHLGRGAVELGAARDAEDPDRPGRRLVGRRDALLLRGLRGLLPDVVRDLPHHAGRGGGDLAAVVGVRGAALPVVLGEPQGRHRDVVVERARGLFVHVGLGHLDGLFEIAGEQPLVEALLGAQHRIAAEEHAQEFELGT
jgi:hypothetical protein